MLAASISGSRTRGRGRQSFRGLGRAVFYLLWWFEGGLQGFTPLTSTSQGSHARQATWVGRELRKLQSKRRIIARWGHLRTGFKQGPIPNMLEQTPAKKVSADLSILHERPRRGPPNKTTLLPA